MKYNLENKKVFITGSSGGIGNSLSEHFHDLRCELILTSSDENKLLDLEKKFGKNHSYYKLDLSNINSLNDDISKIIQENNNIDILINNAGITDDNLLLRMKQSQWENVMNVNLNSNYYILKNILPNMIKNRKGVILGITSVVALTGNPGQSNYTSSKAGLIGMYKSLALEVAQRNIRVNLIAPGFIESPMTDKLDDKQKQNILNKIPMNKFGSSTDIANLATFLSTEYASYITGQTFHVNGGMLML